jgi:CRP-like cAMP-binding protein/Zn-dependent protease
VEGLLAALVLVLVAGGLVGNLYASRRRRAPGVRLYPLIEASRSGAEPGAAGGEGRAATSVYAAVGRAILRAADAEAEEAPAGIWETLAERVDPAEFRPELAPDIEVKEFRLRWGNDYAMVANPRALLHYRLEPGEAELLPLMDGTRTVKEIVVERLRESGGMELSGVADLVLALHEGNFLTAPYRDTAALVRRGIDPVPVARAKVREFAKTLRFDWQGAHRLVAWFYRHGMKWFFNRVVAILASLAAIAGGLAFWSLFRSGTFGLSGESPAAESLILLAMSYLLTFVHELSHAVVLVRYGRRVKSAGFMIYFGSPAFFVESSDALMLDRGQRIVQSLAGPYSELIIAGLASAVAWGFPNLGISPVLYKFALLNYFVIFLNLVPLLELDGYWILSDAIQVPDLRPRSLQFIQHDLWHKLRRRGRFTKQEVGLGLYAVLGVAFTILALVWSVFFWEEVFGGLVRALWDGGLLGRVLLVMLALFLLGPVLRGAIALVRLLVRRVRALARAIRFRLQTSWRVEAATLIDELPIFEDLPEDVLSDLAGRVQLRHIAAGKTVFRQGDRPKAFYVVRRGTLRVVEEDPETSNERVLRTLGRGESFGELGLVDGSLRTATVRASVDGELFEVDEATFDRLLADTVRVPEFAPTVQAVAELRQIPAFATVGGNDLAEILEQGAWRNLPPGETIIEQGDEGDAFYAIRSGQVEVFENGVLTRTMGPGAHFGEIALLMDVPRTATVVARTPVRLFRLPRDGFDRAVAGAFRRGTLNPAAAVDRTWQH